MRGCDGQREREKQAKHELEPKLSKWLRVFSSIWILIRRAVWIVQFVMDPLCVSRTHALYPMDTPWLEKKFLIQKWNSDHTANSTVDVSLWGYIPFWRTLKWSLINTASHLTSRNAMETDIHKEEQHKKKQTQTQPFGIPSASPSCDSFALFCVWIAGEMSLSWYIEVRACCRLSFDRGKVSGSIETCIIPFPATPFRRAINTCTLNLHESSWRKKKPKRFRCICIRSALCSAQNAFVELSLISIHFRGLTESF